MEFVSQGLCKAFIRGLREKSHSVIGSTRTGEPISRNQVGSDLSGSPSWSGKSSWSGLLKFVPSAHRTTGRRLSGSVALLALLLSSCTSTGTGPDGKPLQMTANTNGSMLTDTLQSAADQTVAAESGAEAKAAETKTEEKPGDAKQVAAAATAQNPRDCHYTRERKSEKYCRNRDCGKYGKRNAPRTSGSGCARKEEQFALRLVRWKRHQRIEACRGNRASGDNGSG
ncbi:hypothetical protein HED55_02415 [Ochrobactrum haematophilum]|uniref:Uncharacterized protein n=1 Tax=Brucella haematophila TaxID=419474 RepID=A0ABX1DI46_9HYPH|nr:hypothetical protein [Brucella haematophila]